MRPTLQDIAKDTGLSVSTVSRVLSRSERTNSENENLVLESARKLNYPFIRNNIGKGDNQAYKLALVTEMYEGEFYSSLLYWFYQAAIGTNAEVAYVKATPEQAKSPEFIAHLRNTYDGLCIFLSDFTDSDYEELHDLLKDTPTVSLAPIINPVMDTVTFDSYRGGHLVAKHFDEMGYRDVGVISGPANKIEALYRKNGFLDYIARVDSMNCIWIYEGDYTVEAGHKAYENLVQKKLLNLAIFGSNDQTCFGFMKQALKDGKTIPGDFAIAGYDNLPFCKNFYPELTSVSTDFYELCKTAISMLEKKLQGQNGSLGHVSLIPVTLYERASTLQKVLAGQST